MTIFLMPFLCNKSPAFVFLIYLLPLIRSTTPSYSIVFLPGFAIPLFHYNGSHLICHPAHLLRDSSTQFHFITSAKFPKAPFSAHLFSIFIPLLLALSLISASSITHLLYADDTQLFVSFVPKKFSSAISNLQSIITFISSWMSSNYPTLNHYKTKFLLISLPQ